MNYFTIFLLDLLTVMKLSCLQPVNFYLNFTITLALFVLVSLAIAISKLWKLSGSGSTTIEGEAVSIAPHVPAHADHKAGEDDSAIGLGVTVPVGDDQNASGRWVSPPQTPSAVTVTAGTSQRHLLKDDVPTQGSLAGAMNHGANVAVQSETGEEQPQVKLSKVAIVFRSLSLFWLWAYPAVSVKSMRVFVCLEVQGKFWLAADLQQECYTPQWSLIASAAAITLIVYTAGLPIGMTGWLWSRRKTLEERATMEELGFLYSSYGTEPGQAIWGVVELVRELCLTSIVLFFNAGSAVQVFFALLISSYAHVGHAWFKPYTDRAEYWLYHGSLLSTTFVFAIGLLLKVDGFGTSNANGLDPTIDPDVKAEAERVLQWLGFALVAVAGCFLLACCLIGGWRIILEIRRVRAASRFSRRKFKKTSVAKAATVRPAGAATGGIPPVQRVKHDNGATDTALDSLPVAADTAGRTGFETSAQFEAKTDAANASTPISPFTEPAAESFGSPADQARLGGGLPPLAIASQLPRHDTATEEMLSEIRKHRAMADTSKDNTGGALGEPGGVSSTPEPIGGKSDGNDGHDADRSPHAVRPSRGSWASDAVGDLYARAVAASSGHHGRRSSTSTADPLDDATNLLTMQGNTGT